MTRLPRNYIKSSFFHVMVQGINKENIFNYDKDKKKYLELITKTGQQINVDVISYCIMSNHSHLLIHINSTNELSEFMHKINTLYALYYNKEYDRVGYVYRDRYKSQVIYSEQQLYACINYIHNNPVKAKICKKPNEYTYSSFKQYHNNNECVQNIIENTKSNLIEIEENIVFLELEEERENEIKNYVREYLIKHRLNNDELMKNREYLEEIVYLLKNNYDISIRKISQYLNIGRETVRAIVNKLKK